jgi:metal-responsive CopG/Arc/MetJ family transcriptional regulator
MSRRRTGTRYVPITISLKPSMVDDIEAMLGPKQSRSQWVADAIAKKMDHDGHLPLADHSTGRLLSEIRNRTDINGEMKGIIEYWLSKL